MKGGRTGSHQRHGTSSLHNRSHRFARRCRRLGVADARRTGASPSVHRYGAFDKRAYAYTSGVDSAMPYLQVLGLAPRHTVQRRRGGFRRVQEGRWPPSSRRRDFRRRLGRWSLVCCLGDKPNLLSSAGRYCPSFAFLHAPSFGGWHSQQPLAFRNWHGKRFSILD